MINIREEILKSLPIENFFTWWMKNWSGTGFQVWADVVLKEEEKRIWEVIQKWK